MQKNCKYSVIICIYTTDLMQHRARTQIIGQHSPSAPTRSSVYFNGLELGLALKLERKP